MCKYYRTISDSIAQGKQFKLLTQDFMWSNFQT